MTKMNSVEMQMRDAMREIMNRYNEARAIWIEKKGKDFNENEFHAWFTKQVQNDQGTSNVK
jgi:hypothetical protein